MLFILGARQSQKSRRTNSAKQTRRQTATQPRNATCKSAVAKREQKVPTANEQRLHSRKTNEKGSHEYCKSVTRCSPSPRVRCSNKRIR